MSKEEIEYSAFGKFLINRGIDVPLLMELIQEYSRNEEMIIITDVDSQEQELMAYFKSIVLSEFSRELVL
jgi:5S rRNA maturation endonuclease (ribonuclease M5)